MADSADTAPSTTFTPHPTNVLLLIADDMGIDQVAAYGVNPAPPPTPVIDELATQGIRFDRAYANPVCSPTRATMLTGEYAFHHGIGNALPPQELWGLSTKARSLPRFIDAHTDEAYDHSAVGKWHLSSKAQHGPSHALDMGFRWHAGSLGNLIHEDEAGTPWDYFYWEKSDNGELAMTEVYATTDTVNDAISRIEAMSEPWLMWVAFNAPHYPYHAPPNDLHTFAEANLVEHTDLYHAMIEAMDHEIGRLLDAMNPDMRERTTVMFIGDNGTPEAVNNMDLQLPNGKATLYETGVRVPLVVTGPFIEVPGSTSQALVNTTDVFATVADITIREGFGRELESFREAVSFLPIMRDPEARVRETVYAEYFKPNGLGPYSQFDRTLVGDRHKLIKQTGKPDEMYDVADDPREVNNLLSDPLDPHTAAIYHQLEQQLIELVLAP